MDELREALSEIPGDLAEAVKAEVFERWNTHAASAMKRQEEVAGILSKQDIRAVDGLGELALTVDPQIYHFWNWKLPGCWSDPDFIKWFKKNYPACVVKSGGTGKTMLLMPGFLNRAA